MFSEYTGSSPPALRLTRYSPIFDLGFGLEVDAEDEASGVTSGRGVRRRVCRVRPLRAMRVGIILRWWTDMQQTTD